MSTHEQPRCVDCGARSVPLDNEQLCQACFVVRGLRAMAEQLEAIARVLKVKPGELIGEGEPNQPS